MNKSMKRKTTLSNKFLDMYNDYGKNTILCSSMWYHISYIKEGTLGSWTHQNVLMMKYANTNMSYIIPTKMQIECHIEKEQN